MARLRTWWPAVAFLIAVVVLMPQALAGRATYVAVDLVEATSPYRDALDRAPKVVSPIQTDQVEQTPPVLRFMDGLKHGRWQLWEPRVGMGTPTAATFPWLTSPFNVVYLVVPGWYGATLDVALTLLVGQLLMFLFLRGLRTSRGAATFGAVAYAFTGTNLVFVQRPLSAVWILPGLLWAIGRMYDRPSVARGLGIGAFVAWCWFEGFPSVFAYSAFTAVAWGIWLAWRRYRREAGSTADRARRTLVPLVTTGVGFAWGGLLAMITLVPFVSEVSRRGLLELRDAGLHSHLPPFYVWGLLDLEVNGNPLDPGTVWGGINPYESVTMVGSVVLVAAFGALVLAALGRLRLAPSARDAWPFFVVLAPLITFLVFVGTRVLGLVYEVPGIASNPFHRSRFLIALALVVLATLLVDHLLGRRHADGEAVPRAVCWVALAAWAGIAGATADDFLRAVRDAGKVPDIRHGLVVDGLFLLLAVAAVLLGRWRRVGAAGAAVLLSAVVFAQVAYPLRDFTPEAPVADFYRDTAGYRELRELGGGEYRFAATTFNYYPGSAALLDLYDVRGLALYDEELRHLLEAATPQVFARDPLKQQLFPDEIRLTSPIYDHLALRHFVLATGEVPYGETLDLQPTSSAWRRVDGSITFDLRVPEGRQLAGFATPMRAGPGCEGGQLRARLIEGDRVVDLATKPARDALGDWTAIALTGRDLLTPAPRVSLEVPDGCELDVGIDDASGAPALRLVLDDPDDGVELVATEQGWIYERPAAWPIVSVHTSWRWHPDQEQLLAELAPRTASEDVVELVGTGRDHGGSGSAEILRSRIEDSSVTATVRSEAGDAIVVLSQDHSEGWEVTVDGRSARMESVDGALMGVIVPRGTSTVRFDYRPTSVRAGAAGTALAVLLAPPALWLDARRRRAGTTDAGAAAT